MRVAVFGSLTIDEIERKHRVRSVPGGSALYVPATLAFYGLNVSVISHAGRDFPQRTLGWLERQGVDIGKVSQMKGLSTRFRLTYANNRRSLRLLHHTGMLVGQIRGFWDAIHLGAVFGEIGPNLVKSVRARAGLVSLDLQGWIRQEDPDGNIRLGHTDLGRILRYCDMVKMSDEEARVQTGKNDLIESALKISKQGPRYVVITSGSGGTTLTISDEEWFRIPAYPERNVVDTTGAGDSFVGSWVSTFLTTNDPYWAACVGSAFSSMVLRRYGIGKFRISKSELLRRSIWVYKRAKRFRRRAMKKSA